MIVSAMLVRKNSAGQDRRRTGQRVGLPAAGHEAGHAAAAAAEAEPPPSERCRRTTPIRASTMIRWTMMRTVCIVQNLKRPCVRASRSRRILGRPVA